MATSKRRMRMFVDEIGHAGIGRLQHENDRYLSLTGIVLEQEEIQHALIPQLEALKDKYFGRQADGSPIILHRKELMQRKPPFHVLSNEIVAAGFDRELLRLLTDLNYLVITVVLDKKEHVERYSTWRLHPYNYCMELLAERYVLVLEQHDATGDLMAEARGKSDDAYLRNAVGYVLRNGNNYVGKEQFVARIVPPEPIIHPKKDNIAGLQLADLLAHPSFIATKARRQNKALPSSFGGEIAKILESDKYRRGPSSIDGYGRKWSP